MAVLSLLQWLTCECALVVRYKSRGRLRVATQLELEPPWPASNLSRPSYTTRNSSRAQCSVPSMPSTPYCVSPNHFKYMYTHNVNFTEGNFVRPIHASFNRPIADRVTCSSRHQIYLLSPTRWISSRRATITPTLAATAQTWMIQVCTPFEITLIIGRSTFTYRIFLGAGIRERTKCLGSQVSLLENVMYISNHTLKVSSDGAANKCGLTKNTHSMPHFF